MSDKPRIDLALTQTVFRRAVEDTKAGLHHPAFWITEVFGGGVVSMIAGPVLGLGFVAAVMATLFLACLALAPMRQRDELREVLCASGQHSSMPKAVLPANVLCEKSDYQEFLAGNLMLIEITNDVSLLGSSEDVRAMFYLYGESRPRRSPPQWRDAVWENSNNRFMHLDPGDRRHVLMGELTEGAVFIYTFDDAAPSARRKEKVDAGDYKIVLRLKGNTFTRTYQFDACLANPEKVMLKCEKEIVDGN